MTTAFIGLGSNIEPEKNLAAAIKKLSADLKILAISSFYRTKAIGTAAGQADFINGVIKVSTSKSAFELKYDILRKIEFDLGRSPGIPKYAPRTIDLDILIFGEETISELKIPEPDINLRPFVYIPLKEIEPAWQLPADNSSLTATCILEVVHLNL